MSHQLHVDDGIECAGWTIYRQCFTEDQVKPFWSELLLVKWQIICGWTFFAVTVSVMSGSPGPSGLARFCPLLKAAEFLPSPDGCRRGGAALTGLFGQSRSRSVCVLISYDSLRRAIPHVGIMFTPGLPLSLKRESGASSWAPELRIKHRMPSTESTSKQDTYKNAKLKISFCSSIWPVN